MDTTEFLKILNKGIGVGFVQAATKRPQGEAIAKEVLRIFGEGEILDSALKQLELKMTPGDSPTFYKDPEMEAFRRESLGKWYSYDKLKFENYPEFHNLATDELIEQLKTQVHLLGFDGMGDPICDKLSFNACCQKGLRGWLKEKLFRTALTVRKRSNNQPDVRFPFSFDNA